MKSAFFVVLATSPFHFQRLILSPNMVQIWVVPLSTPARQCYQNKRHFVRRFGSVWMNDIVLARILTLYLPNQQPMLCQIQL